MKLRPIAVALMLGVLASVGTARADVLIDDFNNNTVFAVNGITGTFGSNTVAASGNVGTFPTRNYFINIDSNANPNNGAQFSTFTTLSFSVDAGVSASGDVTYDNNGANLGLSLLGELGFRLLARSDQNAVDAAITVSSNNGAEIDTVPFSVLTQPLGVFQQYDFLFTLFPTVDFSNIDFIRLSVAPGAGGAENDVEFDDFATFVPEPSTMLIAGFAAFGLIGARVLRRKRSIA